jgi:hypothetical protein
VLEKPLLLLGLGVRAGGRQGQEFEVVDVRPDVKVSAWEKLSAPKALGA